VDVVLAYRRRSVGWISLAARQKIRAYNHRRDEQRPDRQKDEDWDPDRDAGMKRQEIWRDLTREERGIADMIVKQVIQDWRGPRYEGHWYSNSMTGEFERRKVDVYRRIRQSIYQSFRLHGTFDEMESKVDPLYAAQKVMEGYAALTGGGTYRDPGEHRELWAGNIPYGGSRGYLEKYLVPGAAGESYRGELAEQAAMEHAEAERYAAGGMGRRDVASEMEGMHEVGREDPEPGYGDLAYLVRIAKARNVDELHAVREEIEEWFSATYETAARPQGGRLPGEGSTTAREFKKFASGWDALLETDFGKEVREAWVQQYNALAWDE
jgi:hypothetical protein